MLSRDPFYEVVPDACMQDPEADCFGHNEVHGARRLCCNPGRPKQAWQYFPQCQIPQCQRDKPDARYGSTLQRTIRKTCLLAMLGVPQTAHFVLDQYQMFTHVDCALQDLDCAQTLPVWSDRCIYQRCVKAWYNCTSVVKVSQHVFY